MPDVNKRDVIAEGVKHGGDKATLEKMKSAEVCKVVNTLVGHGRYYFCARSKAIRFVKMYRGVMGRGNR